MVPVAPGASGLTTIWEPHLFVTVTEAARVVVAKRRKWRNCMVVIGCLGDWLITA